MTTRKSKRVLWEIMIQLDEAGEEDICSLLNQVMGAQPNFGSGDDLAEYLDALTVLEDQGELVIIEYRIEKGHYINLGIVAGKASRPVSAFAFDLNENIWKWGNQVRQMVELPDS